MAGKIPVSVLVMTRNESARIGECLLCLQDFDEVIVVDSDSTDETKALARAAGARVVDFIWNGRYPKKRQWCLDTLQLKNDRVFFVDADERVTPALVDEIRRCDFRAAGYFITGQYVFEGRVLRHGLRNRKLALFDRRKIGFPEVDDLGLPGMGEIEGHYQPRLKVGYETERIGYFKASLIHEAYDDPQGWDARHRRYAQWEAGMNARRAWPDEDDRMRRWLKRLFRALPLRPWAAFFHCYVLKGGFREGGPGLRFARSRAAYYRMISDASKDLESGRAAARRDPAAG